MLVAVSLAVTAGLSVSAFDVIPNLFYPFMLLIATLIFIFFPKRKKPEVTASFVGVGRSTSKIHGSFSFILIINE